MIAPLALTFAGAGAGLIAGSFLSTLAIRWPLGKRATTGRSLCDGCGRTLGVRDLIPLMSWAMQRGKCRTCAEPINPLHPLFEGTAAAIGIVAAQAVTVPLAIVGMVFGWGLLLLLVLDAWHFWLPNRVTLPLGALGLIASVSGAGPAPRDALIGAAAGFGALWLLATGYRALRGREGLGGGDPKMLGAIGAWCGWASLPFVLLGAASVGLALVLAARLRGRVVSATDRLPFGALMAVAAWPVWLVTIGWRG